MSITREVVVGTSVESNTPPQAEQGSQIVIDGEYAGKPSRFGITADILSKHILLVGGTGSGKTNLVYQIVDQIKTGMTANDVMLVFDSKGDFFSKFYSMGDVVIGNSIKYRKQSEKWCVYEEIVADGKNKLSILQNAQEICKSFFIERTENSTNPFFPNAARDLLASIMISLIRNGTEFYNKELRELLDTSSIEDIRNMLEGHRDLSSTLSYISGKASAQAQGVLSELYSTARDIFTGVFADVGKFSMRRFIRNKGGKTAFIEYDLAIGSVLSPVYTLLFDLALKEALGRTASQGNVYLIADELKLLPNLQHLEDGINFGRSLGLKIIGGLQSVDQLNANYTKEAKAKNIVSGFSSIVAFQSRDATTRKYVGDLFGKNITLESYSVAGGQFQRERIVGNTVEDWCLNDLRVGEAVVGLPSTPPFKFRFQLYKK